jgi:restriction endonuclease S subunit
MFSNLKPYPSMAGSSLDMRETVVPPGWSLQRVKNVCRFNYGDALASEIRIPGPVPVMGSNGQIGWDCRSNSVGPTIVIGRKGSFGKVRYVPGACFVVDTAFYIDERLTGNNLAWLAHALQVLRLDDVSRDSAVPGLDRDVAYDNRLAVPPREAQAAIVKYLAHANARIDRAMARNRKLVALLHEQGRAIVDEVLAGRDGRTTTRQTTSRWFPEVQDGWAVATLGRVIRSAIDGPHFSPHYLDSGVPFLSARNVKVDRWQLDDVKYISRDDFELFSQRVCPKVGDVLYTKGGTTGVARVVDLTFDFQVWVHIAVLECQKDRVDPRYLAMSLNSTACFEQAQLETRGATNQDLGLSRMKRIEFPLPASIDEQRKIVEEVEARQHRVTEGMRRFESEIELLQEFKTRLTSDVVTGQVDVQEIAASLPDLEPEQISESDAAADEQLDDFDEELLDEVGA